MCFRDAKRKKEEGELSTCGQTCVHLLYSFITIVAVQQAHASCTFSSTASVVLVSLNLLIYRLILKTSSMIIVGTQNCTTNKIEEMMASRSSSNKRKCFSLELKAEIISEVDKKKKTKAQICRDYFVSRQQNMTTWTTACLFGLTKLVHVTHPSQALSCLRKEQNLHKNLA